MEKNGKDTRKSVMCGANLLKLQNGLRRVVDVYVSPNISGMEVLTYISCMDTAYVRENPPQDSLIKVQYLHIGTVPETFGECIYIIYIFYVRTYI